MAAAEQDRRVQEEGAAGGAAELVMKTSEEDLAKFFDARVVERSGDPAEYLRAVWRGAPLARAPASTDQTQAPHSKRIEARRFARTF